MPRRGHADSECRLVDRRDLATVRKRGDPKSGTAKLQAMAIQVEKVRSR